LKQNPKKPIVYKFSELASRINGISIPIFGVSWKPSEPERATIRSLLIFLEDRRALYNPFAFEMEHEVAHSVLEIRTVLTDVLQRLPEASNALQNIRAMRAACREYLDSSHDGNGMGWRHSGFLAHLGRLRTIFGYHIAQLAVMYGIDVEGELAKILPPEYKDEASTDNEL